MLFRDKIFIPALLGLFLFFSPKSVFATTSVQILDLPNSIQPNQTFEIKVAIQSEPNSQFYLKVRLGQGSTLTKALTYNPKNSPPDDWLSDTDSWSKFPQITTDQAGSWEGTIQAKAASSISLGENTLIIRARSVSSSNNYDSEGKIVTVSSPIIPPSSPSPSPTPSPIPNPSSIFQINNLPSTVLASQTLVISITLLKPNSPNTQFYLKGAFKKIGSTNYFGLTKVGNNWIKNNANYQQQLPITTDSSGAWQGQIELKVDKSDSGFGGSGEYLVKVALYSTSGSLTWSNEYQLTIIDDLSSQTTPESILKTSSPRSTFQPSSPPKPSMSQIPATTSSHVQGISSPSSTIIFSPKITSQNQTKVRPTYLITFLGISGMISGIVVGIYQWKRKSKNI